MGVRLSDPPVSSISLSAITAGTLQVPLNMVGSSSLTSTNVQVIGNNTNDLLLHVPDTGSIGFAEAGNVRLRYQYYASPGAGFAPASYLYNNTSGAGNNTDKLILAGGTPDPSIGTSVGTFSYVAVYGYDAEFTYGAYGSVHYGTATVGASVANAKHYFHGYNDTGGFPSVTIAPAGIEIYKLNQAYAVLLRANNITAARTFDFPDASGTLMVSGGSGSVSLSNLTAGTLGVSLQLGSASDSPASSVAYVRYNGTSLISNVPTSKDHRVTVNGVLQAQVSAGSGQVGPSPTFVSNASQGAVAWSSSNVIASTYEGSTTQGYSAVTSGVQTVTLEAATNFISGATQAKFRVIGNATTPYCEIGCGNTIQQTFNANGIQLNTGAGSVTAGTRGIYQTSTGIIINNPTSTSTRVYVNNAQVAAFAATQCTVGASPTFATDAWASQLVTGSVVGGSDLSAYQGGITQSASVCSVLATATPYTVISSQTNLTDNATRARVICLGHATIPNVVLETAGITRVTVNVTNTRVATGHNFVFGSTGSALATSATDGFIYAPSCAGTPSGVPTAYTGTVPLLVDTTAGKLWAYYGGAWHYTTFT